MIAVRQHFGPISVGQQRTLIAPGKLHFPAKPFK
jgi:hypothetical protein